MPSAARQAVCFGPFRLDPAAYRLYRGAEPIDVSPHGLDLLQLFVAHRGELVTKNAILEELWRDVAVTENAVTQVISELREALGDSASAPVYIETVTRRGYRFIAAVEAVRTEGPGASAEPSRGPGHSVGRTIAVLDFVNVTADPELAWLGPGIAESLTSDLRALGDLTVIDRALIAGGGARLPRGTDPAAAAGVDLVVAGSIQRAGDRIRLGARIVQTSSGAVIARAKADGPLADIFDLQDALVAQLSAELNGPAGRAASLARSRETSNLEAYRALTEARLRLERLDPAESDAAVAGFEHALALDPRYALAHVGLAHAHFWRFQHTRADNRRDQASLTQAVAHARRAIDLDPELAEAYAALAFFLASAGDYDAAVDAGRRAVRLEPGHWRHLFRLGMAAWGSERLTALHAVIAQFPELAYAHFGLAMIHVARQDFSRAEAGLAAAAAQSSQRSPVSERFPAAGLHWLLGAVRLAGNDITGARAAFDAELQATRGPMLADEYEADALTGHGFALLAAHDPAAAGAMFERALQRYPAHTRALIGLAESWKRRSALDQARRALGRAETAIAELRAGGRAADAALSTAFVQVSASQWTDAVRTLLRLLPEQTPTPVGWSIPIEPLLAPLRRETAFQDVLTRLRDRAR